jgi:hypothetical protein
MPLWWGSGTDGESSAEKRWSSDTGAVTQEANIEVVRRIYATGCWESDGDPTLAFPPLDDNFEFHNPEYAVVPGVRHGHEGFAIAMQNQLDAFERFSHRPLRFDAIGDHRVIAHCHVTAHGRMSDIDVSTRGGMYGPCAAGAYLV